MASTFVCYLTPKPYNSQLQNTFVDALQQRGMTPINITDYKTQQLRILFQNNNLNVENIIKRCTDKDGRSVWNSEGTFVDQIQLHKKKNFGLVFIYQHGIAFTQIIICQDKAAALKALGSTGGVGSVDLPVYEKRTKSEYGIIDFWCHGPAGRDMMRDVVMDNLKRASRAHKAPLLMHVHSMRGEHNKLYEKVYRQYEFVSIADFEKVVSLPGGKTKTEKILIAHFSPSGEQRRGSSKDKSPTNPMIPGQMTRERTQSGTSVDSIVTDTSVARANTVLTSNTQGSPKPSASAGGKSKRENSKKPKAKGKAGSGPRAKKRNYTSFKSALSKVLKQVHPEHNMSSKGMSVMNDITKDLLIRLCQEINGISLFMAASGRKSQTISSKTVQTAVRLLLPGELSKRAVSEGTKAVTNYVKAIK